MTIQTSRDREKKDDAGEVFFIIILAIVWLLTWLFLELWPLIVAHRAKTLPKRLARKKARLAKKLARKNARIATKLARKTAKQERKAARRKPKQDIIAARNYFAMGICSQLMFVNNTKFHISIRDVPVVVWRLLLIRSVFMTMAEWDQRIFPQLDKEFRINNMVCAMRKYLNAFPKPHSLPSDDSSDVVYKNKIAIIVCNMADSLGKFADGQLIPRLDPASPSRSS